MASHGNSFDSLEDAAVANWPAAAHPRVLSVAVAGDRAEVVIEVEPNYPYWVYCVRRDGRWREIVSGNGPTVGWDDPNVIDWDA